MRLLSWSVIKLVPYVEFLMGRRFEDRGGFPDWFPIYLINRLLI